MHHIFRYAALTIVAASAHDARQGLLHDHQPWQLSENYAFSVPILYLQAHATALPRLGTLTLCPLRALPSHMKTYKQPINQRAWCLQEELMSPRSLLFSHTALFRCQTATHSIGTSFYDWNGEVRPPDALLLPTPSPPKHGTPDWHDIRAIWMEVVHEYSCRSMTEPSDKLVACAAIAETFHRVLGSDYLAGLWSHSLLTDLLWCAVTPQGRPATFRAPSWSWAAVDNQVGYKTFDFEPIQVQVAEVVRCVVSLKEDSLPFGEVSGGSLVLSAHLLRLQLADRHADRLLFSLTERALRDHRLARREEDAAVDWVLCNEMTLHLSYSFDAADDFDDPCWIIPLVYTIYGVFCRLRGLIVTQAQPAGPSAEGGKALYRRIGLFSGMPRSPGRRAAFQSFKRKELPLQEIEII